MKEQSALFFGLGFWALLITVLLIILGFRECDKRGRERYNLQKIYVERCQGTPDQAERVHPYPPDDARKARISQ